MESQPKLLQILAISRVSRFKAFVVHDVDVFKWTF